MAAGLRQEGIDNKAVSQSDRMLGKQVAGEESRMQDLDKFGSDLAMRKDRLAFAQKVHKETSSMAEEKLKMAKSDMNYDMIFKGIEFGLGAASVGTEYWRSKKQKEHDKLDAAETKARTNWFIQNTGTNSSNRPAPGYWEEESY
jgi:hypothetical protein